MVFDGRFERGPSNLTVLNTTHNEKALANIRRTDTLPIVFCFGRQFDNRVESCNGTAMLGQSRGEAGQEAK